MPSYTGPPKIMTAKDLLAPAGKEPSYLSSRSDTSNRVLNANTDVHIHTLEKRDTLLGLSLKYGVSVSELKLANDIPFTSDNLHSCGPTLRIPLGGKSEIGDGHSIQTKEESDRAILRRFRVTHNLEEAEAKYYLSLCNNDFEKATIELQNDLNIEAKLKTTIGSNLNNSANSITSTTSVTSGNIVSRKISIENSTTKSLSASLSASLWSAFSGEGGVNNKGRMEVREEEDTSDESKGLLSQRSMTDTNNSDNNGLRRRKGKDE